MTHFMSPQAARQAIDLGIVDAQHFSRCCHSDGIGIGPPLTCTEPALIVCGGCQRGTCAEPYHAYLQFVTTRDGGPYDRSGAKFFYHCEQCVDFLCVRCLGIQDDYPCAPSQLEEHLFECPQCHAKVTISKVEDVDMTGAICELVKFPSARIRLDDDPAKP